MPDAGLDAAILLGCTLCGAGLFALGWLVGHLDREGEYWRGRRDGYERCDAERAAQAERRAAVLRRLVGGAMVNEGDGW